MVEMMAVEIVVSCTETKHLETYIHSCYVSLAIPNNQQSFFGTFLAVLKTRSVMCCCVYVFVVTFI